MGYGSSNPAFKKVTRLKPCGKPIHLVGELPGEGVSKGKSAGVQVTAKDSSHQRTIQLKKKIAEGGEGSVFETNVKGYVAKVYFRSKLTTDRADKLKIMISSPIDCEGVCFPEALILNSKGEFVGYLMKAAKGHELGRSIFQPKLFMQKFPNWTKPDSIELCLNILEKIEYLNSQNIIIGDINPANILVVSPREVYFVDCDSYQIEGYPCPVGTANYTAPEAQGRDYKTFLRTQEMENFAIATLMFMIMLPGKPPYSAVGGASPEKNIADGVFPYPLTEDTDKTPPGKWGFIWSHLSYKTKEAFFQTFKRGERHFSPAARYDASSWKEVFAKYRHSIGKMANNDPMALKVFPDRKKGENVVETRICRQCRRSFDVTRNQVDWEQRKSDQEGKPVRIETCDDCKASGRKPYRAGGASYSSQPIRKASSAGGQPTRTQRSYQAAPKSSGATGSSKIQGYAQLPRKQSSRVATSMKNDTGRKIAGALAAIAVTFLLICAIVQSGVFSAVVSNVLPTGAQASSYSGMTYQSVRDGLEALSDAELAEFGYMRFGSYATESDGSNQPIYWICSGSTEAYDEYISVFVLDWMPYDGESPEADYAQTGLYKWLNADFFSSAFTDSEKSKLAAFGNGGYVQLLDLPGASLMEESGISLSAFPTPYATSKGAEATWEEKDATTDEVTKGLANWWLSYIGASSEAPTAYEYASDGHIVLGESCGVVPVIRVMK